MSIDHNRIKVSDLETNQPNQILITNDLGQLEFREINNIKIDSYNALDYTEAGKSLDARQGKVLKDLIDNINALLASDNVNLNTLQELVDAIEVVQNSLNTLLVNDLTTGGATKALTAEMGKQLQNNKVDKVTGKSLLSDTEITRLTTLTNYIHPANHPPGIIIQDSSNRFVTDAEKTTWNAKQANITTGANNQYFRGDKTWQTLDKTAVGLANVDNTADLNKPISTATQTAFNSKADLLSPPLAGTPTAPTAIAGTNTTQIATTAFVTNAALGISNNAVLITGNQIKTGVLSFDNGPNPSLINGIRTNSGSNALSVGAIFDVTGNGATAVTTSVAAASTGYKIDTDGVNGIFINSKSTFTSSSGITVNGTTGSAATLYRGQNNGTTIFTVNKTGDIVANTYTGGATLTGTPTAPTAATGTNTTQIATTAFVTNSISGVSGAVTLAGAQTITGDKTFDNTTTTRFNTNKTIPGQAAIIVNNTGTQDGIFITAPNGYAINANTANGAALAAGLNGTGYGLYLGANASSTGSLIGGASTFSAANLFIDYKAQLINGGTYDTVFKVDRTGSTTAKSFIKTGAAINDTLMADGTSLQLVSGSYTPTVTNGFNVTSSILKRATYSRVGNIVTATISVESTPTSANMFGNVVCTLPFNRATNNNAMIGTGISNTIMAYVPTVCQTQGNTTVNIIYPTGTLNTTVTSTVTIQYSILD